MQSKNTVQEQKGTKYLQGLLTPHLCAVAVKPLRELPEESELEKGISVPAV